jgi:hypothetical protein
VDSCHKGTADEKHGFNTGGKQAVFRLEGIQPVDAEERGDTITILKSGIYWTLTNITNAEMT